MTNQATNAGGKASVEIHNTRFYSSRYTSQPA